MADAAMALQAFLEKRSGAETGRKSVQKSVRNAPAPPRIKRDGTLEILPFCAGDDGQASNGGFHGKTGDRNA